MKKQLEWILFTALTVVVIVSFFYQHMVLNLVMLTASILYLAMGWYFFNPGENRKFDPVFFILSYAISITIMALFFRTAEYPLADLMLNGSTAFLVLALILILVLKKSKRLEPLLRVAAYLLLVLLAYIS